MPPHEEKPDHKADHKPHEDEEKPHHHHKPPHDDKKHHHKPPHDEKKHHKPPHKEGKDAPPPPEPAEPKAEEETSNGGKKPAKIHGFPSSVPTGDGDDGNKGIMGKVLGIARTDHAANNWSRDIWFIYGSCGKWLSQRLFRQLWRKMELMKVESGRRVVGRLAMGHEEMSTPPCLPLYWL
eukprot:CAMPEP_0183299342 /NCGR_PEP_ID=MMETSP0160_2-20130417/6101_1 /TAXON_ID=2839 ORGANISM="Odontella Sinensis, Strain Grunow 1884" /NCGR_SAMPLE_ID=MMETSP0160_2 /ASSEMBLY_ACC=CAM_ASM_000250 /LENGTH=179 /DNA_ID=CAMNT_0025461565 /DNA_START=70 /DNA_END=610 /DNA_ORIENTATION=-